MGFLDKLFGKKQAPADTDNTDNCNTIDQIIDQKTGNTRLHVACSRGALDQVQILLSHGADVNITNKWGATPLDLTYSTGSGGSHLKVFSKIAEILIAKGGKTNTWKGKSL